MSDLVNAESAVDSLRLEIRKLDREIQAMKQDYADGGDVGRPLAALAEAVVLTAGKLDLTNYFDLNMVAYGEAQIGNEAFETTFETYASWQLNTWTFLSPHLQAVRNDLSLPRTATVLGLRVQFNF